MTSGPVEMSLQVPSRWLRPFLLPFSLVYSLGVSTHRCLYSSGILKTDSLPRPVVSIGNLTAGGGGKTPVVIWLAGLLSRHGWRPAVLSRGYGRDDDEARIVDIKVPWMSFGDEPYMMANLMPEVPVSVAAKRNLAGIEVLKKHEVDLFILDDGFSHHALKRDMDIVVVDQLLQFGNGNLMPAGILREPLKRLKDADFIVVTRANGVDEELKGCLERYSKAPILWAEYRPGALAPGYAGESVPDKAIQAGPYVAFCGIAGPEGFRKTLDRAGVEVCELITFPDHHPYCAADVKRIVDTAYERNARGLITTEKDAVRWPPGSTDLPLYTLPIKLRVDSHGKLITRILELAAGYGENV